MFMRRFGTGFNETHTQLRRWRTETSTHISIYDVFTESSTIFSYNNFISVSFPKSMITKISLTAEFTSGKVTSFDGSSSVPHSIHQHKITEVIRVLLLRFFFLPVFLQHLFVLRFQLYLSLKYIFLCSLLLPCCLQLYIIVICRYGLMLCVVVVVGFCAWFVHYQNNIEKMAQNMIIQL